MWQDYSTLLYVMLCFDIRWATCRNLILSVCIWRWPSTLLHTVCVIFSSVFSSPDPGFFLFSLLSNTYYNDWQFLPLFCAFSFFYFYFFLFFMPSCHLYFHSVDAVGRKCSVCFQCNSISVIFIVQFRSKTLNASLQ